MAIVWFGFRAALGTSTPFFVVSSRSMVPTLEIGDILVIQDGATFSDLKRGDLIVFYRPLIRDLIIVHRVVAITDAGGERLVTTKGDANTAPDARPVREADYIGRVIFTLPRVGYLTTWLAPPVNYLLIAVILAIIFLSEAYSKPPAPQPPEPPGGRE